MADRRTCVFALAILLVLRAAPAEAASHLWRFSEFYSSPDRSVQFIEMQEIAGSCNETNISEHWYTTNGYNQDRTDLLGSDIGCCPASCVCSASCSTANKKFLVGTQSYAALPGVPAPDYVLPDGFLDPSGDTVVWWFYQTKTIPVMPSDGRLSISVSAPANPASGFVVGENSPTNFAGVTGTVVLPERVPSLSGWASGLAALLVVLVAWPRLVGRSSSRESGSTMARRRLAVSTASRV